MARQKRYVLPGYSQHIIQRGNNRQAIFIVDKDYQFILDCLLDSTKRFGLYIHAYVLMPNHIHLLATPRYDNSIGATMQSVGRRYVQYFNQKYKRTGTLWDGRYRATILESTRYLLVCSKFIELNPVRANIVHSPAEYPWSSYNRNAIGEKNTLITEHKLYKNLGSLRHERQHAYQMLFNEKIPPAAIAQINNYTEKGWALGNDQFKKNIEWLTQRRVEPLPRGRRPFK